MTSRRALLRSAAAMALLVPASDLSGQSGPLLRPTHEVDASILPQGALRLRSTTAWTRWNELIGPGGSRPLGFALSSEEAGAGFPEIASLQQELRTLTGSSSLQLSIGRALTRAGTRTVVTPIVLELGVLKRVQLSAAISVVQARTNIVSSLEASEGRNLGINPARGLDAARSTNGLIVSQLSAGSSQLQQRLAACRAAPADPSCASVLANEAAVEQLITATGTDASRIAAIYGTSAGTPGASVVPLAGSTLQGAVDARIASHDAALRQYLGSAGAVTARPVGAAGPLGATELHRYLTGGADTLESHRRYGLGDMELGATVLLLDRWGTSEPRPVRARAAVQSLVRLPTGFPARRGRFFDIGTGDGQLDVEGALLADLLVREKAGLSASVRHTQQVGRVQAGRASVLLVFDDALGAVPPAERTLGPVTQLQLTPRWVFARALSVEGHYGLIARGDDSYFTRDTTTGLETSRAAGGGAEHRAGFGIRYSSLMGARMGTSPRLPFDVAYLHLQTVSASGATVPKIRRDQLQLIVYYQLFRRR